MQIQNFMFGAVTVAAGSKVEVENEDSAPHTVNVHGANIDVSVSAGGKATFTAPAKAGTYSLTCDIHPSMHGSLVVS
jgi:plastocyanin